jgi:hypothetical protein
MSLLLITLFASNGAFAQNPQKLPDVVVTATTLDGASVMIPFFLMQTMYVQLKHDVATIDADNYSTTLTKAQVCSKLKANQPTNCSMGTYPAAPGMPNALGLPFAGNGCGADPYSSFIADRLLTVFGKGYSGNLNRPVTADSAIDFTGACNNHDGCYTSPQTKLSCDTQLGKELLAICSKAGPAFGPTCVTFSNIYTEAVNEKGDAAYYADQKDLKCSTWGNSMKANKC